MPYRGESDNLGEIVAGILQTLRELQRPVDPAAVPAVLGLDSCVIRRQGSDQPVGSGAWTNVEFDVKDHDTAGFFDVGTSDTDVVIPAGLSGLYLLAFSSNFVPSAAGTIRGMRVYRSNVTSAASYISVPTGAVYWWEGNAVNFASLVAGDYLQCQQYQDTGGDLDVDVDTGVGTGDQQPTFSLARLG